MASLFPAETFAYAELQDVSLFAEVWAGFVKGTPLEGSLHSAADHRDRIQNSSQLQVVTSLGQIGMLASPEFRREAKSFKGIAIGATRFQPSGNPDYLAVVMTGNSQAAGLIVKWILISHPEFRRVASQGETPIYQQKNADTIIIPEGKDRFAEAARPKPDANVPTFAYRPGLFVLGSNLRDVTDALKRFEGRATVAASLAESKPFQAARSKRHPPSLFAMAFPRNAFAEWDKTAQKLGSVEESDLAAWLRFVLNPKSVPSMSATISVGRDGWTAQCQIETDPAEPSPILGLLTEGNAALPNDREPGITLKVNDPRGERQLAFADAVARAMGTVGRFPSDIVRKAEKESGTKWKSELLPAIESIRLIALNRGATKPIAQGAVVMTLKNADLAARWEQALPGLLRAADPGDKLVTPSVETVNSLPVRSYAVPFARVSTLHTARAGNRMAFAVSRDEAAGAIRIDPPTAERRDSLIGRWPLERLFAEDSSKPHAVRPPLAPPATAKDLVSLLPDLGFSVVRQKDSPSLTVLIDHRGWEPERIRQSVMSLVNWWENRELENVPGPLGGPIEKLGMSK